MAEVKICSFYMSNCRSSSPKKLKDLPKIDDTYIHRTYNIGKVLGKGAYGKVYEITSKTNANETYAVKYVRGKHFNDEYDIHKELDHKNIVKLVCGVKDFYFDGMTKVTVGFLIMERCFCDLREFVINKSFMPITTEKRIMQQILMGVTYLHSRMIVHRDLKPENILIRNGVPKISDFGTCARANKCTNDSRYVGTLPYLAPEILKGSRNYSYLVDSWSLGCTFLTMVLGEVPFRGENESEQWNIVEHFCKRKERDFYDRLGHCLFAPLPEQREFSPFAGLQQLSGLFRVATQFYNERDATKNFIDDLERKRNDPKLTDLLFQMLEIDLDKRIQVSDALTHPYFS